MAYNGNKKEKGDQLLDLLFLFSSGWQDSNLRPPGPKPGAMTGLRYIPNGFPSSLKRVPQFPCGVQK